jgi:hypothetical protein
VFYIKRNAEGELLRVQPEPFEGMNGELHADSEEARSWFSNQNVESSLLQLKQSDLDMIRVLDDLIQVLTSKGIIRVTDLPAAAQAKLKDRSSARVALGGLNQLINDDETGLI